MTAPASADLSARYVEVVGRLYRTSNLGAMAITLLTIGAVADNPRSLVIAIAFHAVLFPTNLAINHLVMRKLGPRIELPRTIINVGISVVGFQLIGWPLPCWFWLPFGALTFDQFGGRQALSAIAFMCIVQSGIGLACGVPAIYPIAFTALACVCWSLGKARLQIIRDMLARSEDERDQLARVHADLKAEVEARQRVEIELRHVQKLEAVGRLASGVAHEINTPIQFIGDNIAFVREGVTELLAMAERCAALDPAVAEAIDLPYLSEHVPTALGAATDGLNRVASLVRSMKRFAHPGHNVLEPINLDQAIEATLAMAAPEYRMIADTETRLCKMPLVRCNLSEINQVLLNLIVNAAHAIDDAVGGSGGRGKITITSSCEADAVVISIADTGAGIPEAIRDRIFEPFFTTKEVGRGTGQGLAIARSVVRRHGGEISFETELGRGTTFHLRLPIKGAELATPSAA